jgi:hypothetical protein
MLTILVEPVGFLHEEYAHRCCLRYASISVNPGRPVACAVFYIDKFPQEHVVRCLRALLQEAQLLGDSETFFLLIPTGDARIYDRVTLAGFTTRDRHK